MISEEAFIHPLADVADCDIGPKTRVWQFVVILAGARIGEDCNVCSHVFIDEDVIIGDRVTIKYAAGLGAGLRVGDNVFIGPNVIFPNDPYPRSKVYPDKFPNTFIEDGVSIGTGTIVMPGIRIGAGSMIAAGSLVRKDVAPLSLMAGNPLRLVRKLESAADSGHECLQTR